MKKPALIFLCLFLNSVTVYAESAIPQPKVAATGAVLMDAETGRVLWGKNEHAPMAMASTTKIMTAVLALESGRAEETVTVSKRAVSAPPVEMGLTSGEKIKLGDLTLALMLESKNDAAVAIAEHLGGSVEEFCRQMTAKAKEIGAKDTLFVTPNGLDAGDHHSTAYDLALIARYALNVPGFVELTNTRNAHFSSDKRSYSMQNYNRLLREYAGANGVKTGFTGRAGHCFVGAAKRGEMQLISVVLASGWGARGKAQKWADTKAVLDFGFAHYGYETVLSAGDRAGTLPVTRSRSASVDFIYDGGLRIPMNRDEKETVSVRLDVPDALPAPVQKGDAVGTARVFVGDFPCGEIKLITLGGADRHDLKTSMEKFLDAWIGQGTRQPVKTALPEFPPR